MHNDSRLSVPLYTFNWSISTSVNMNVVPRDVISHTLRTWPSNETSEAARIIVVMYRTFVTYCAIHSVQQNSTGMESFKSGTGSDVRYSRHHNSRRFNFPHICAFVAFLCLPFITINHTAYILTEDDNTFA